MPPDVEFEVSVLVDVVSLLVVFGLPAVVGVGIITWVVSLGLSTGRVHVEYVYQTSLPHTYTTCYSLET